MSEKFEQPPEPSTECNQEPEAHETIPPSTPWFIVGEEEEVCMLSPEAENILREQNVFWEFMPMSDLEMYLGGSPVLFEINKSRTGNYYMGRAVAVGNAGITGFLQSDEFYKLKQLFEERSENG